MWHTRPVQGMTGGQAPLLHPPHPHCDRQTTLYRLRRAKSVRRIAAHHHEACMQSAPVARTDADRNIALCCLTTLYPATTCVCRLCRAVTLSLSVGGFLRRILACNLQIASHGKDQERELPVQSPESAQSDNPAMEAPVFGDPHTLHVFSLHGWVNCQNPWTTSGHVQLAFVST